MPDFVHLRVHTEYSLVDSLVRIGPLVGRVAALDMPAVAICDLANFHGLVKFYKAALAAGVKPLFGVDLPLGGEDERAAPTRITLLAANLAGYHNLIQLISRASAESRRLGEARADRGWLPEHAEGLIALSGGRAGDVGRLLLAEKSGEASERLDEWMQLFPGRFYLELQRTGREGEEDYLHAAVQLAGESGCPVVATNDVCFLDADEFEAHDVRVCIGEGRTLEDPRRSREHSPQQYLRSPAEMAELFSDIPEALENSVEIARRCNVELELGNPRLPDCPVPAGLSPEEYCRRLAREGLDLRLAARGLAQGNAAASIDHNSAQPDAQPDPQQSTNQSAQQNVEQNASQHEQQNTQQQNEQQNTNLNAHQQTQHSEQTYRDRLEYELDVIVKMGFAGYYLIVMDFIRWSRDNGIPVGPGRGSGPGSLVAWALEITDLDPIEYDLLFERFLNPDRVSMPDFDVDICKDGRDRVIQYVTDTYGHDLVAQIVTFDTMAAKAVVRDVARVQNKPYSLADKMAGFIPFGPGVTLAQAHKQEAPLRELLKHDDQAQEIWDMALQLEGLTRNAGKHAAGVVIAPSRVTDFSPLYFDKTTTGPLTQYDKIDVEEVGLVKFDFLGLRTVTAIHGAVSMINQQRERQAEQPLDISAVPLDDANTFELLCRGETTAVFQLESGGMRDLIKRLRPDHFEDIIAVVALFRPGPLESGMVDNFINRKHGREEVAYPDPKYQHKWLQPILEPTYGIILYQEQVMQIAQELAGFSLADADVLRRAMGKKNEKEMAEQRAVFEAGAKAKGVQPGLAVHIFDLVEKFAGYGFNKSHSACYALLAYQTAWLKTHYPSAFMAAMMSSELQNTDKIVTLVDECLRMKLSLRYPDVNEGERLFRVGDDGAIIYGLGAIKGLGEAPVENLLQARKSGPFTDLFDFCARTDPRVLNRGTIEALVRAGAFDSLGEERAVLMASLEDALQVASQRADNEAAGMEDLFGEGGSPVTSADVHAPYRDCRRWSNMEILAGEKATLGLWITGHPYDEYAEELRQIAPTRIVDLYPTGDERVRTVSGLVVKIRQVKTRRGTMAAALVDDRSARIEAVAFSEVYEQCRDLLKKDAILVLEGTVYQDDRTGEPALRVQNVCNLEQAREKYRAALQITLREEALGGDLLERIHHLLGHVGRGRGEDKCPVLFRYHQPDNSAVIRAGENWRVTPSDELIQQLRECCGASNVILDYPR